MNYAQDRLDRRELLLSVIQNHIDDDSTTGNTNNSSSTCTGTQPDVSIIDHTKYGQICMMLGWNIHALYHYGRAWYEEPTNCYKLGDYVQMMEIYGYPELALLTVFLYRTLTTTTTTTTSYRNSSENGIASSSNNADDDDIIRQLLVHPPLLNDKEYTSATSSSMGDKRNRYDLSAIEMIGNHCGCNDYLCGKYSNKNHSKNILFPYWIPMSYTAMTDIVVQFQLYCERTILFQYQYQQQQQQRYYMNHRTDALPSLPPTAHEILGDWTDSLQRQMSQFIAVSQQRIPALFQFWYQNESSSPPTVPATTTKQQQYRALVPVVQLLCVKILYLVLPSLAIEAMVHIRFQQQQSHLMEQDSVEDEMTNMTKKSWDKLSIHYKSHWAYYIFIEALVLGERIKPSRRRQMVYQHIALWDRLWGMNDVENGTKVHPWTFHNTTAAPQSDASDVLRVESIHGHSVNDFVNKLQCLVDEIYMSDFRKYDNNATRTCLPSLVYLQPILHYRYPRSSVQQRPLFLIGDSHVLSTAWQSIDIPVISSTGSCDALLSRTELRLIVPIVITGLKAWHLRPETRFFTNTCFHTMLRRIPPDVQTIIISAGEIDCREGMGGPLLQGYTQECYEHVKATVAAYVSSLAQIIQQQSNSISQILVTPVAPHIERNKGRVVGHASRRETIRVWNDEMRRQLQHQSGSIYLLNYIDQIQVPVKKSNNIVGNATRTASVTNDEYALNPIFNADSTHMNAAYAPILQEAIVRCQCDLSKL